MRAPGAIASLGALAVTMVLTLSSCMEKPRGVDAVADSLARRDSIARDTSARLTSNLPPGRFELPTTATPAPNLWISLPEGYRVKGSSRAPDDIFFIVHTDDPGLEDSTAVTPGYMRVYVGPKEQHPFEGERTVDGDRVFVAGQPLQWRLAEETLPDGARYFKRDLRGGDILAQLSPDLAEARLALHIYVAGIDSARVAALMRSAESISVVP